MKTDDVPDELVDILAALSDPSKHSQLCPVWTGRARKTPVSRCGCWIRRNAVRFTAAVLPAHERQVRERVAAEYQDLLASIWLYVKWRYVTKQLTTEQKELWADAVEASGDPDEPTAVDRWWRE
ncbi:MAG: hypothetical protein ACRDQ0_13045 [Pseudonocardia sp.]